jgi:hypothetical protein
MHVYYWICFDIVVQDHTLYHRQKKLIKTGEERGSAGYIDEWERG